MSNLQHRQTKIQEKRKQTPRRDFVMEICSWVPLNFYKNNGQVSRYPTTDRIGSMAKSSEFYDLISLTDNLPLGSTFFQKYQNLQRSIKMPLLLEAQTENSDYADNVWFTKNTYLSFAAVLDCENILYSIHIKEKCKNVMNSLMVWDNSENIFNSKAIIKSSNIYFSQYIYNSTNIWNSANMVGCNECIGCSNLENQSYYIDNISYSKEEYIVKKIEILKSKNIYTDQSVSSSMKIDTSNYENIGFSISSHNVENAFNIYHVNRGKNLYDVGGSGGNEDMYDSIITGSPRAKHFYATLYSGGGDHAYCCEGVAGGQNNYYSYMLIDCSFCLGCVGLTNQSYCILNKQYTKEEWYEKVDEIFAQMEADDTLGEFFPATMNPFYFNDTAAYLIDPSFTKEEVTAKGYLRRDEPIKVDIPEGVEIIKTNELDQYEGFDSEGNWTINKDILKKIIQDDSQNIYRIVPMEYDFLVKHGLPLPRKHRLDRMKENFRIN